MEITAKTDTQYHTLLLLKITPAFNLGWVYNTNNVVVYNTANHISNKRIRIATPIATLNLFSPISLLFMHLLNRDTHVWICTWQIGIKLACFNCVLIVLFAAFFAMKS